MILFISTNKEPLHQREFVKPLTKNVQNITEVHYNNLTKEILEEADKIIICGTGLMDNDYFNDLEKFNWLKNTNKPILGICSGAQIIALIFGGKVEPNRKVGMLEVSGNLFGREKFSAYSLHQNGITNLEEFEILAKSETVEAIKHKEKEIYGILFHPEVRNMWIIDEFLKLK